MSLESSPLVSKEVVLQWPDVITRETTAAASTSLEDAYRYMGFSTRDLQISVDGDKPDPIYAIASYMTTKYHSDIRKTTNSSKKIELTATDPVTNEKETKTFYCAKNVAKGVLPEGQFFDNQIIQASTMGLNKLVAHFVSKKKYLLTPIARALVSDEGLFDIADWVADKYPDVVRLYHTKTGAAIAALNIACNKRAHQFHNVTGAYIPEIAAAAAIVQSMGSQNVTGLTKSITQANVGKIWRTAPKGLDSESLVDLMVSLQVKAGSMNLDEIWAKVERKKAIYTPKNDSIANKFYRENEELFGATGSQ